MFRRIEAVIREIPKGRVSTYGDVAYAAGFPGAARQVAWALHGSRGLPWQRVVGAGGRILLPGEAGFEQRMRLQGEDVQFAGLRVRMDLHQHDWFTRTTPQKGKAKARATRRRKKR